VYEFEKIIEIVEEFSVGAFEESPLLFWFSDKKKNINYCLG
jgi:hypothetical protein